MYALPKVQRDDARAQFTVTVTDQLLAATRNNEGAFVRAFRQEMQEAMNTQKIQWAVPKQADPVKEARAQLKRALAADKAQRKQAKAARRAEKQRHADIELALETLRSIAKNPHEYANQRRAAALDLLHR